MFFILHTHFFVNCRNWKVVPSGESRFEVRNGYQGFKVDEKERTCSCRAWQLSGIPCQHGIAVIYFLHKEPYEYLSRWYSKEVFMSAYNHYIQSMNGMDQWPATEYQKPLPPIKRRMPGRPPHKRKRDASEDDGKNRTRISRKGQTNHCTLCHQTGHNQRSCPKKPAEGSVSSGKGSARGGKGSVSSGKGSARGGKGSVGSSKGPAKGCSKASTQDTQIAPESSTPNTVVTPVSRQGTII